jgi:hypothetical protein
MSNRMYGWGGYRSQSPRCAGVRLGIAQFDVRRWCVSVMFGSKAYGSGLRYRYWWTVGRESR